MNSAENVWIEKVELRYALFIFICSGYFAYGLNITLIGVAFQDLTAIIGADSEKVSQGITIRFIVNCFAALFAGFSFNLFSRQFQYAISLLIHGMLIIVLPFVQNVAVYFISSAAIGIVSAFIDCVTNLWIFELFPEKVNFHVLIAHFCYSTGQILAPLIVRPYLSNQTDQSQPLVEKSSRIQIPFLICGLPFLVVSFFMFLCYIIKPYVPPRRFIESKDVESIEVNDLENEINGPKKETIPRSPLPRYYYNSFFVIISLILGFEIANELNLNFYLPTYLNKSSLRVDQNTITLMMSTIGVTYCVGRFLNIILALKVDALAILYFNLLMIVTGNLVLTFLATEQQLYLTWLAISLLGLGYSTTFPCLFSFIESRITITNGLNSFLVCVTSTVFTINSLVIGNSIDHNPSLFQYLNSTFSILFVILFALLHSTDLWKRRILKNFV